MSKRLLRYAVGESFQQMFALGGNDTITLYYNRLCKECDELYEEMKDLWDTEEGEELWNTLVLSEADREVFKRLNNERNTKLKKVHLIKFHLSALADFAKEFQRLK